MTRVIAGLAAAIAIIVGCASLGAADPKSDATAAHEAARRNSGDPSKVTALMAHLPKYKGYVVYEGDLLLTEQGLSDELMLEGPPAKGQQGGELKLNTEAGKPTLWSIDARRLSYAVDRSSFATTAQYDLVVANMKLAAADWVNACTTCGVSFTHHTDLDGKPSLDDVTFIVRGVDVQGEFIAASFFPNDTKEKRYLNVDKTYFNTSFDKVGVFRHELGHVLGYRHEHIAGVPGCYKEGTNWVALTVYDPKSAMHYFCGGAGSMTLALTALDKTGHATAYSTK